MPLVTSVDGAQTFGMDAMALFPRDAPTLTTPPWAEQEFPLYLKPKSEAFEDVIQAVVRSLRQPATPLNTAFFSRTNVDALQVAIHERIKEAVGVVLDRQSDWQLLLIMRRVYMETSINWPDDVAQEVARLNGLVFQIAAESVSRNVAAYMEFRSRQAQPVPLPNPADMLVQTPFPSSTPAPPIDLNADMNAQRATQTPMPLPVRSLSQAPFMTPAGAPPVDLNADMNAERATLTPMPLPVNVRALE